MVCFILGSVLADWSRFCVSATALQVVGCLYLHGDRSVLPLYHWPLALFGASAHAHDGGDAPLVRPLFADCRIGYLYQVEVQVDTLDKRAPVVCIYLHQSV